MIEELFYIACPHMDVEQLRKVEKLTSQAEQDADNIKSSLNLIACALSEERFPSLPSNNDLAKILWGLSYQAGDIAKMIRIGGEAGYHADKLEKAAKATEKQPGKVKSEQETGADSGDKKTKIP